MTDDAISIALREAADALADLPGLPHGYVDHYLPRHTFDLQLIVGLKGTDISLWDLGGGSGVFTAAAARLGIRSTLVDDFKDLPNGADEAAISIAESLGVNVIRHDFDTGPAPLDPGIDVVTTFHTIEHLHSSPRAGYQSAVEALAQDGLLVIAGPNAVNLRKRITGLIGKVEWSSLEDWYYSPTFRAHVREPRLQDFLRIADDLELDGRVLGKNFLGQSRPGVAGWLARVGSPLLERHPALCSDIYLIGRKRGQGWPDPVLRSTCCESWVDVVPEA